MQRGLPSISEERWLQAAADARIDRQQPWIVQHCGGWHVASLRARALLFALGLQIAGAVPFALQLDRGINLASCGLILVVAAESLTRWRRSFHSGLEEALEVCGFLMIAVGLLWPTSSATLFCAAITSALALAAWRLLNSLFVALSLVAASIVIYTLFPSHHQQLSTVIAGIFCFACASISLWMSAREFARPSQQQMLDFTAIVSCVAGIVWMQVWAADGSILPRSVLRALLPMLLGASALFLGLKRRRLPELIAALVCAAGIFFEFRHAFGQRTEYQLISIGALVLGSAVAVERYLRTPRRGIYFAREVEDPLGEMQEAVIAASTALPTSHGPPDSSAPTGPHGHDGKFGGGGASQSY